MSDQQAQKIFNEGLYKRVLKEANEEQEMRELYTKQMLQMGLKEEEIKHNLKKKKNKYGGNQQGANTASALNETADTFGPNPASEVKFNHP